jgi:hypothetical protein
MESTPSRIAADILIAALGAKNISILTKPENIAEAFNTIHAAVHDAAEKDKDADLFNVFK